MKIIIMAFGACVLFFNNPAFAGKATIAVGTIEFRAQDTTENKRYRAYGNTPREDTRAFVDMLTTALVKTKKFNVIERDRMTEILKEQGLTIEGIASGGYEGGSFNLQGVDYILTGAITEYGQTQKGFKVSGFSTASTSATMAVDIRVLKVADGTIGVAETVRAKASGGSAFAVDGLVKGDHSGDSALLGTVMRKVSKNVTNLIVSTFYPIKVVRVTASGDIMLNYGNAFLEKDDVLEVYSQGEVFKDPDTGEVLGNEEELIGKITVFDTQNRFSKARPLEDIGSVTVGMIARIIEKRKKPISIKKHVDLFSN